MTIISKLDIQNTSIINKQFLSTKVIKKNNLSALNL